MLKSFDEIFKTYARTIIIPRRSEIYAFSESKDLKFTLAKSDTLSPIEPHRPPKEELRAIVGKQKIYSEEIGDHPDFCNLKENESEYHYIVSVFLDIKGSTRLATKLPLEDVRFIKNGTIVTAIDIFQAFDGHIHRLQGDAVFALFGRKGMKKSDAIVDALNATTFLQVFFKKTLAPLFEKLGLPQIKIRIGIDFGDSENVMWSRYGIINTSEITPTSLHTDLASKLQNRAPSMSIMLGNNIVSYLDMPEEFISVKTYQSNDEKKLDEFILKTDVFSYRMWKFEWEKYFNRFIIFSDREIPYTYKASKHFAYRCYHDGGNPDGGYIYEYKPNCGVLSKEINLKFVLEIPKWLRYDSIIWEVNNRGKEAESKKAIKFEMERYRNKNYCYQSTIYNGHHYMRCTIKHQNRTIADEYFGIYINNKG